MLVQHAVAPERQDTRLLFVVGRDRPSLYDHLREGCHGVERIDVLLDRRHTERRRWGVPATAERRLLDRRNWRIDEDLGAFGFAIVLVARPVTGAAGAPETRAIPSLPATVTFLRDVALFRTLDDEGLTVLAGRMREEFIRAGTVLVREGEAGDRMFVVRDGTLIVSKAVTDSVEKVLVHVKHGQFFGEMSLFTRRVRSASVRAQSDCVVLTLDRDGLAHLVESCPKSALHLLTALVEEVSDRLSNTDDMLAEVTRWGLEATGLEDEVEK